MFTIGRRGVFSLGRWSSQIPAGFHVPCGTRVPFGRQRAFAHRAVTFSGRPSQVVQLARCLITPFRYWDTGRMVPRLPVSNAPRLTLTRFRLFPVRSPLLGASRLISFPRGTEMFQFSRLATSGLCIQSEISRLSLLGFPIRRSTDRRLLAPSRGFSQLSTSFIASRRLGIHRAPLVAFPFP